MIVYIAQFINLMTMHGYNFFHVYYGKNITNLDMAYEYIDHNVKNNKFDIYLQKITIYLLANNIPLKILISCINIVYVILHYEYMENILHYNCLRKISLNHLLVGISVISCNIYLIFFTNLINDYDEFCCILYISAIINFVVTLKKYINEEYFLKINVDINIFEEPTLIQTCICVLSILRMCNIMNLIRIYTTCFNEKYNGNTYGDVKECEKYIATISTTINFISNLLIILANIIFFGQSGISREIRIVDLIKTSTIIGLIVYSEYTQNYFGIFMLCINVVICFAIVPKYIKNTKSKISNEFYAQMNENLILFWLFGSVLLFVLIFVIFGERDIHMRDHFSQYINHPILTINFTLIYCFLEDIIGTKHNIKPDTQEKIVFSFFTFLGIAFNCWIIYAFYHYHYISHISVITCIIVLIFELNIIFNIIIQNIKCAKDEIQDLYNKIEGQYEYIEHKKNEDYEEINNDV